MTLVGRLLEHSPVEMEPGQFTVDETVRIPGQIERNHVRAHDSGLLAGAARRGFRWNHKGFSAMFELNNPSGKLTAPNDGEAT